MVCTIKHPPPTLIQTYQRFPQPVYFLYPITHLAGLDVEVTQLEEALHHTGVGLRSDLCQGDQHSGGVASLVLLVHVAHLGVQ